MSKRIYPEPSMKENEEMGPLLKLETLTPIWTGGVREKSKEQLRLRETGIIGSLRWWYEVLIRGLGRSACDPTANTRCEGKNHCDACELFGCTGWARKFKLNIEFNDHTIPGVWIGTRKKHEVKKDKLKYLIYLRRNVLGFMSPVILSFIPLREISKNEWILLNATFEIIGDYGAIGAHTSQGNGVIKIIENNLPHKDDKIDNLEFKKDSARVEFPSLDNFFFYKFHLKFKEDIPALIDKEAFWTHQQGHKKFSDNWGNWEKLWNDYNFLPIAFHIRDTIRHFEDDRNKRHSIFGKLGEGSKVFVSHGYKIDKETVETRIWGYDEEGIKEKIKENLNGSLREKLFSDNDNLESCNLIDEKLGKKILEGVIKK
ncbi:TPA: type III-B CRISPR module RAMP protein Cmr1 [bacterium]|nr:type III-B CRISPR module RAMP protein Cmr1 [bacterium]